MAVFIRLAKVSFKMVCKKSAIIKSTHAMED